MNLLLATLPDDPALLPTWLERQLTGPELAGLVAELTAVHGDHLAPRSVIEVLGADRAAVLSRGLGVLPVGDLQMFLAHPRLLLDLQEMVLAAASPYWDRLLDAPEIANAVARGSERLKSTLGLERATEVAPPAALKWYRRPTLVAFATAAAVLIAVYLSRPSEWGWNRPGVLAKGATASAHFTALADAASEWRGRPKDDPAALAKTLREMRDGCTRLLAVEHPQLAPPDRKWLATKCVTWGARLDQHLADLTANGKDWQDVRREADDTVDRLIQALRKQAADA